MYYNIQQNHPYICSLSWIPSLAIPAAQLQSTAGFGLLRGFFAFSYTTFACSLGGTWSWDVLGICSKFSGNPFSKQQENVCFFPLEYTSAGATIEVARKWVICLEWVYRYDHRVPSLDMGQSHGGAVAHRVNPNWSFPWLCPWGMNRLPNLWQFQIGTCWQTMTNHDKPITQFMAVSNWNMLTNHDEPW